MKYLILALLCCMANAVLSQELPGTVARWKMDNSCELTDEIAGSPLNGVLVDIASAANRDNVIQSALSFNSNTSYITLGVVEKLKLTGDQSISFWIKPALSGTNRTGSIFCYGTGVIIRYEEQNSIIRLNIIFGNTSYLQVNLLQAQWQLVTITFQKNFSSTKSKVVVYVNGTQVGEAEQNKTVLDFTNAIAIIGPANQNALTNGFRGSLDDLRIFDRTLASAEVYNLTLPVRLKFFQGKPVHKFVELNWKTDLEENVSHFFLQKSLDGVRFQNIKKIDAGKFNYLAYDLTGIPSLLAWYRLQIVDIDGRVQFSHVIKVRFDVSSEPEPKVFPNPTSKYVNLVVPMLNGNITIINSSGSVVRQQRFQAGQTVDVSGLRSGLYHIILFNGNRKMIAKFIKQ